ncbi:MAG: hypothetical protein R3F02_02645 [Thiolinea sp.]
MGHDNNDNDAGQAERPVSVRGQLEYVLKQLAHEDLSRFVLETAVYDPEFREAFLITFSEWLSDPSSEATRYQLRLRNILTQYTNRDGFISAKNATDLNAAVSALLHAARKPTTPVRESVDLAMAVMEVMPQLGDRMDDAEGYLYSLMEQTCTVLLECFDNLQPEAQQQSFELILGFYGQPEFLDLDLDSFLLILLKDWSRFDKKRQSACLRVQERMLRESGSDQWRKGYLIEQTNELLKYWKSR